GNDQEERPTDQREYSQHVIWGWRDRVRSVKTLPQRVERTRANVAIDHAESAQRQTQRPCLSGTGSIHNSRLILTPPTVPADRLLAPSVAPSARRHSADTLSRFGKSHAGPVTRGAAGSPF